MKTSSISRSFLPLLVVALVGAGSLAAQAGCPGKKGSCDTSKKDQAFPTFETQACSGDKEGKKSCSGDKK